MKSLLPPPLKAGDVIGTMSPSSYITEDDLAASIQVVENHGYTVKVHPQTLNRYKLNAGSREDKVAAFHDLIRDDDVNAIIFSTGGNRALDWVDLIDFDLVARHPKIIMGFSDCTAPLNIINAKTGLVTFHGPNLRWFMVHQDNEADSNQCFETLTNPSAFQWNNSTSGLIGGNLTMIQYLVHDLDFEGKTLFLEDWNLEVNALDRMFIHLKRQGVFEKIAGLMIGQFDNLCDSGRPFDYTIEEIVADHVPASLHVEFNIPIGHGNRLITMPIGG